jgi:hypothetical protein
MGSCQSQLTIIHVAILDCLCTGERIEFLVFGHMALLPGVPPFHFFLENFCSTNRGQLSGSKAFEVHLAAFNWLFHG